MVFLRKFLPFILFATAIILVSVIIFGYRSLQNVATEKPGSLYSAGLDQPVDIRRDEWGIPHIYAQNEHDLFFAAGFACAQDRLWQLDLFRRAATGRLSEIMGEPTLAIDELARTVGLEQTAQSLLAALPIDTRNRLDAYVAGINAFIKNNNNLPLEFALLHYTPEPWRPQDTLALQRLLAWMLSMGWHIDPVMGDVAQQVDPAKLQRIMPDAQSGSRMAPFTSPLLQQSQTAWQQIFGFTPQSLGSNAWVVTGLRTQNRSPILANDTHLPFSTPALYYLMHLSCPSLNVIGASFPGLPGVVIGRNEKIAWGITNGMIDDVDFFQLKPDSADPSRYLYHGQSMAYQVRSERIKIKGKPDRILQVLSTPDGPVMPEADTTIGHHKICVRWTGHDVSDELTAFNKIMSAGSWYEFRQALRGCKCPGENFIYADQQGHIGYQLAASVPVRSFTAAWKTVPDSLPNARWIGEIPFESLPHQFDPAAGKIVSANQCMVDSSYEYHISDYWEPDYRYRRIQEQLDSLPNCTATQMKVLQRDIYNGHAAWLVPRLLASLNRQPLQPDSPEWYARELLQSWDYEQSVESIASTLYEQIYKMLFVETFADEMDSALLQRFMAIPRLNARMLDRVLARQDSSWLDDRNTPSPENRNDLFLAAFAAACDSLKLNYGTEIGHWQWGDQHTITGYHPFLVQPAIGRFFAVPELPAVGGNYTVNNATFAYSSSFKSYVGPCFRQVVDLATLDYQVILFTGQSGHPFSRHHQDMFQLWQRGELVTLSLDPRKQNRNSWTLFRLSPSGPGR
jgi:penicillin G amidase